MKVKLVLSSVVEFEQFEPQLVHVENWEVALKDFQFSQSIAVELQDLIKHDIVVSLPRASWYFGILRNCTF